MIRSSYRELFASGDPDRIVETLRSAAQGQERIPTNDIRRLALETPFPRVRNAAVIALADLHARNAAETIIELLRRPGTRGSRRTLLYALSELTAEVPLAVLVSIIADDTYEAREEALEILHRASYTEEERASALARLQAVVRSNNEHVRRAASEAIEFLSTP